VQIAAGPFVLTGFPPANVDLTARLTPTDRQETAVVDGPLILSLPAVGSASMVWELPERE
jgi:hypothetical protein